MRFGVVHEHVAHTIFNFVHKLLHITITHLPHISFTVCGPTAGTVHYRLLEIEK